MTCPKPSILSPSLFWRYHITSYPDTDYFHRCINIVSATLNKRTYTEISDKENIIKFDSNYTTPINLNIQYNHKTIYYVRKTTMFDIQTGNNIEKNTQWI